MADRREVAALLALACAAGCARGGPRADLAVRTASAVSSLALAGGDLWAGTGAGLVRVPAGGGPSLTYGEAAGLKGGVAQVRAVTAGARGLWLATGAGVALFSPSRGSVDRSWSVRDGLGHDSVRWAGEAGGAVWAATIRGASRLEDGGRRWRTWTAAAGLPQDHVYRLAFDGRRLWAACINGGLASFDGAAGRWRAVPQEHGLGNKFPYAILPVPGALWLGTAAGVNRYDLKTRRWDEAVCADGFTEYCVYALAVQDGTLWYATTYGLHRRDLKTGAERVLGARAGLPADDVSSLLLDGGSLWVGTSGGIARLTVR